MKNLIVLNRGYIKPESRTYPDLHIIDSVYDTVSDAITFVLSSDESPVIEVQQFHKNGNVTVLASFEANSKLLSTAHFVDSSQLVFVFANGDIVTATYDSQQPVQDYENVVIEIVGTIDVGIQAAQWSVDEETLAMITNENKLLLLSRILEPITEKLLDSADIKITDSKHVSVGWGKKETQFKGKGFKALEREKEKEKGKEKGKNINGHSHDHAHGHDSVTEPLRDPTVNEVEKGSLSRMDDGTVRISWRGDSNYFAVSTVEPVLVEDSGEMYDRRVIRVFDREGELDSVNEAVDGLEHNLGWKPQGALIASTQRHIDDEDGEEVLDLVFYERNGLRHGQFNTRLNPEDEVVQNVIWSSDSEILLLQMNDRVQLWTSKNYHWYLKQELFAEGIIFTKFHPEKPSNFMIGTANGLQIVDLTHKVVTGPTRSGDDVGMTLVVDGATAKMTPLSVANVPPPISYRELDVLGNITDLAVSKSNEKYAILTSDNDLYFSQLSLEEMKAGAQPKVVSHLDAKKYINESNEVAKQIAFIRDDFIAVVIDAPMYSRIVLFEVDDISNPKMNESVDITPKVVLLKSRADFATVIIETVDNKIIELSSTQDSREITRFPQLCREIEVSYNEATDEFEAFGISRTGKLFRNEVPVVSGVTSMLITESHLLFTTVLSKLCFVHLNSRHENFEVFQNLSNENIHDERVRQIERGSFLVNTMPSKYSVVLEAPRGNIETICPRIMVLTAIRKFISQKDYKSAFIACRTHRIDLDILHDYDTVSFFNNIELFVNQIGKIEYLDLFVSCLHEEDVTASKYKETLTDAGINESELKKEGETLQPAFKKKFNVSDKNQKKFEKFEDSKVNRICQAILAVLLKPEYFEKYMQTILTAYACEKPPNLVAALELSESFTDEKQKETAITHLCFLQDVNKLYQTCLGLYNVKPTLLIAQQSQMDPKEYLPFLQNLHVQTDLERKFLIDDYLKNHDKALQWLHEMGDEAYERFDNYVVKHELYKLAMKIYTYDKKRTNDVMSLFANYLHDQTNFGESALTYEYLEDLDSALENYILAKKWRQALSIAEKPNFKTKLIETANSLVATLTADHKYSDAAEIEYYCLQNVREAVRLYCKQYWFDQAILLAERTQNADLIESVVDVQINEGFGVIAELLADCKGQMNSQLRRLRELRTKKQDDPYAFYGNPDDLDTPDNVSVAASETSTAPSFFTRYTGKTAGTAKTGASRRTAKNRKREERKKAQGRKGTIYEEEYLIRSVGRLIERLDSTEQDAIRLIEVLIRRQMKEQAYQIQKSWCELIALIKENIDEVHNMSERDRERIDDNGEIYLIDEIPKPNIREFPKFSILDY
ncbi:Putative elongator complex protein 1 [Lodderomyces elongisporus]|uniref:Putative elongator complex protein 1 n=1 Tax=Lodderomyces elongisporus TaxID=36914 RepID=UPI0029207DFB|nr:Putative elongator complex protein 1 [Lodderomyces elongisporus]WLF80400.1 Putative elongator complex protein 1 [Lodderomyces elongisporus]